MAVNRIQRLPPALANQIAAGEVVERPVSVVKELVENAVDAGARRIGITIEFGGQKLLVVEDDGEGMSRADAELAIERHATSKISSASDLAAIRTLGFRGEALPSIASVSRFRLRTRLRGEISGTEVPVEAGIVQSVREVGAPEGTRVEVGELFFNLPARRKFLKADTAESAQVSAMLRSLVGNHVSYCFGIDIDETRNRENAALISTDAGRVAVHVIRTDEELMIARSVILVLIWVQKDNEAQIKQAFEKTLAVRKQFQETLAKKKFDKNNVQAGREFVKAYVEYTHYVKGIHDATARATHGHFPEAAGTPVGAYPHKE